MADSNTKLKKVKKTKKTEMAAPEHTESAAKATKSKDVDKKPKKRKAEVTDEALPAAQVRMHGNRRLSREPLQRIMSLHSHVCVSMSQPAKKKKAKKAATPSPAASGSGDSAASDQSLVVPAPETDASAPPTEPADPLAIDNFALSPAIKGLLRKKGIETLFPIQVAPVAAV